MGRIQYSNEGTYVVACMVLLLVLFVVGWRLVSRVLRCLRFVSGKKRSAKKKGSCCGGMFTSVVVHAAVFCCAGYVLYSVASEIWDSQDRHFDPCTSFAVLRRAVAIATVQRPPSRAHTRNDISCTSPAFTSLRLLVYIARSVVPRRVVPLASEIVWRLY